MNKNSKIIFTMIGLTTFSAGLFAYDNFFLNEEITREVVYVANRDITANTTLTKDMFKKVEVSSDSVLKGYVTDISQINGKKLIGGLLKEEVLTSMRLAEDKDLVHNLEVKIEVDGSSIDVEDNDYYNLYVILNVNGEIKIQKVFDMKQFHVVASTNGEGTATNVLTMKATEEEVLKYYDAKEKGKLVVAKNRTIDGESEVIADYDPASEDAQNAIKPEVEENNNPEPQAPEQAPTVSVVTKICEEGDNLESLSIRYKTNVETIKSLNNNKESFEIGEEIILPAN